MSEFLSEFPPPGSAAAKLQALRAVIREVRGAMAGVNGDVKFVAGVDRAVSLTGANKLLCYNEPSLGNAR
eukprot:6190526-Pleurochrysis_carterae.AAC.3